MNDDAELLHLYAASGKEAAFTALVDRYKGLVYASALTRVQRAGRIPAQHPDPRHRNERRSERHDSRHR